MKQLECDKCGEKQERFRDLKKIRDKRYCKNCASEIRKKHREETMNQPGVKRDLMDLKNKISRERGYARKSYEKRVGHKVREFKSKEYIPKAYRKDKGYTPDIKGSTFAKPREKSEAYLTFEEKKTLLRSLIKQGLKFNEATERIKNLINEQKRVRDLMKSKGNSDKEIKIKQKDLLEELWGY